MSTLKELLNQKAELDKASESTRKQERATASAHVRRLMQEYGLTVADISGKSSTRAPSAAKGGKVAAKYRNAATGESWSGRGLQPKWLKAALASGRQLSDFAV